MNRYNPTFNNAVPYVFRIEIAELKYEISAILFKSEFRVNKETLLEIDDGRSFEFTQFSSLVTLLHKWRFIMRDERYILRIF